MAMFTPIFAFRRAQERKVTLIVKRKRGVLKQKEREKKDRIEWSKENT